MIFKSFFFLFDVYFGDLFFFLKDLNINNEMIMIFFLKETKLITINIIEIIKENVCLMCVSKVLLIKFFILN